jgi:hypothetical protein
VHIRVAVADDSLEIAPLLAQLGYPTTPEAVAARFARVDRAGAQVPARDAVALSPVSMRARHAWPVASMEGLPRRQSRRQCGSAG